MLGRIWGAFSQLRVTPKYHGLMAVRGMVEKNIVDDEVIDESQDTPNTIISGTDVARLQTDREKIIKLFTTVLHCSEEQANELYNKDKPRLNTLTMSRISAQIQILLDAGVDREVMLDHPFIMTMNPSVLQLKLNMLRAMQPRSINDFVPLLEYSVEKLNRIQSNLETEHALLPKKKNRIYYFADALKIPPIIATQSFLKHNFLFGVPLDLLTRNMEVLLEYNVPAANILRDPWVFNYSSRKTRERFDKAKKAERPKLMPWMAHVPMERLNKSLQTTMDQREVLGDSRTIQEYLMKRLQLNEVDFRMFERRHPAAMKVRPTKIKSILDYLMDEEGFTKDQVVNTTRILCYSLRLIRERVEELKKLDYRPRTLLNLTLTEKKYSAFVEQLKRRRRRRLSVK